MTQKTIILPIQIENEKLRRIYLIHYEYIANKNYKASKELLLLITC